MPPLSFSDTGPYARQGPRRKYGYKRDYANRPVQDLTETTGDGHIQTHLYQVQLRHKEFTSLLNVGIIVKLNLHTQAHAHVSLCRSDLTLAAALVDYDGLRCQIALHFRDAKQYWGLEDCMHVTPTGVTQAANLSLCMVNVAYRL